MSFVFQAREYQAYAQQSVFDYYSNGRDGNPVIAMPTGTGKSIIIALLSSTILQTWQTQRLLILCPTKELVLQNYEKLMAMWPGAPAGICSASLGRFDTHQPIIFGTIGTIINRKEALGLRHMVFVDECHLVSDNDETQYRRYFDYLLELNEHTKFVGLSATPYRLGLGHIVDGGLFTDVCCDATTLEAFNWFIDQGYLVPLIPRPTKTRLSTEGIKTSKGDYSEADQQRKFNKEEITREVIEEARELAHDREHILVFCTGIEHAEGIRDYLESIGETAVAVHSKSSTRDEDLAAFRRGDVRWCVNFGILTTGFDMPHLDCIVVVRVTKSPGLWVQILGRGTRPDYATGFDLATQEGRLAAIAASFKRNCLVLDFGYNTATLGPINDPQLPKKKGKGAGQQPIKTCGRTGDPPVSNIVEGTSDPDRGGGKGGCGAWNHPMSKHCVQCGAEFTFEVKFTTSASGTALLAGRPLDGAFEKPVINEHKVTRVSYEIHKKAGRPDSIRVFYYCGLKRFSHFICPEHGGIPRQKAQGWWQLHGGGTMPESTEKCRALIDALAVPAKIKVWENRKYPEIKDWIFNVNEPAE